MYQGYLSEFSNKLTFVTTIDYVTSTDDERSLVAMAPNALSHWLRDVCAQQAERIQLRRFPIDQETEEEITSSFLRASRQPDGNAAVNCGSTSDKQSKEIVAFL